jgi:hypothetical protein
VLLFYCFNAAKVDAIERMPLIVHGFLIAEAADGWLQAIGMGLPAS